MRFRLVPSLSVLGLLLALVIPSLLVAEAARSNPSAKAGRVSPGNTSLRAPGADASDKQTVAAHLSEPAGAAAARVRENYGRLPLSFEDNRGQADPRAQFRARNSAYSLYLAAGEITLTLRGAAARREAGRAAEGASVLRIKLLGASRQPRAYGLDEQEGKSNYLIGDDPSRWRTNVPNYGRVKYEGVYPGVDVIYYGTQRQLEYDFNVAPGADAGLIRLAVEGARGLRIEANGDLVLPTAAGEVRQHAPHAYQEIEGVRREVACRYARRGAARVGFELGAYDRTRPLVIDPVVSYSTYLGGGGYDEATSVAVDAEGNAYVTGKTSSWDFPVTPSAPQRARRGGAPHQQVYDAFVAKLGAEGTYLIYSTYLGGGNNDGATSIAVDGAGQAHVAGETNSADFPTTPGAFRTTAAGEQDVFVSKLDTAGSALLYSTYLGGANFDGYAHLALGGGGDIYVGGVTASGDYPVTPSAFRRAQGGMPVITTDGFVTKLSPTPGAGLLFSTYLGGSGAEMLEGLAVASGLDDSVYVTGYTVSPDFPVTPNALQPEIVGGGGAFPDVFVTRLHSSGGWAVFSTYLGGENEDSGMAVAVGADGAAYVAGYTHSQSFPTTPGVFQPGHAGGNDAFVAKLGADGASLTYSTYFGGAGYEQANAIAVDAQGHAYVAGHTDSANLPVTSGAPQATFGGGYTDGIFFSLDASGASVPYATYLGGGDRDSARGLALDVAGNVYLTGFTFSDDFRTTPFALQPVRGEGGGSDCFITKLVPGLAEFTISGRVTNQYGLGLRDAIIHVTGTVETFVTTDAEGFYTVTGLPPGADVTLTAHRGGFSSFVPVDGRIPNLSRNETVNFTGPAPVLISGRVADEYGNGQYTPIVLTSDDGTAVTDYTSFYDGSYSFYVPAGGTYTVTPGPHPEYVFTPESHTFGGLVGDQTLDFTTHFRPRILGRVADETYGYGVGSIKVTLTGPSLSAPVVQTTDMGGFFEFEDLKRGATYTLTADDPNSNRTFSPAELTIPDIQTIQFVTFNLRPMVSINGLVADANNHPVSGVARLTGTVNAEVQVDQWGYFDFQDLPRGGDYTVTVTKPGSLYTFAPASRSFTNLQEMQLVQIEALPPLRILGIVTDPVNHKGVRATVTLSGAVNATTQADEWGSYEFIDLPRGGDYTVTPSYQLYTFTPPSRSVNDIQANQILTFDALPPLRIMGSLADGNGGWVAGATVTLAGTVNASATTDEWGNYSFEDLPRGGTYTVTPAHDLYNFSPPSRQFAAMDENPVAFFDGARRHFTLSGRAAVQGGAPLPGVAVMLDGAAAGIRQTDADGNYSFADLEVGRGYTVTASRPGYAFAPATVSVTDPRGDRTANFDGSHLTYALTGRVTDSAGGAGLSGATVTLGGALSATTQTDAQGNYTFAGLPSEGNYTVNAAHPNFNFAPASRPFNNLLADASGDFAGTRINYRIGGRVTDGAGAPRGGVTVTLGGARAATTQTDPTGLYLFDNLPSGFAYTLTAARTHYTFSPPTREVDDLGGDTTADFTATLLTHNISGRVVDANGNGFAGVAVRLIGGPDSLVTTDADGNYSFNSLPAGQAYTVEPARQFYSFGPTRASWLDLGGDQTANFTATLDTFSLGGRVAEGTNGLAGVTVNLSGTRTATAQTDAAGNYLFTQLPANGTYTVTPQTTPVYSFSPGGTSFNTLPFNQTASFAAVRLLYQVGGYALDPCGRALPGVTMSLAHDGVTANAQTDVNGFYSFGGVQAGYNYTLSPTGSAYAFTPPSALFPGLGANQAVNFTGRPPAAITNALALADLYVRGGSASSNFGAATQLITRLANQTKDTHETYLKFDVGRPCTVTSVKLRLYGQLSSSGTLPLAVYGVPVTTWTETGTTWNNKPAAGALLRTVNIPGTTAAWYEWDVTDYVRGELSAGRGVVSFALKSTATTNYQATFNSREASGTNAPRLVINTP